MPASGLKTLSPSFRIRKDPGQQFGAALDAPAVTVGVRYVVADAGREEGLDEGLEDLLVPFPLQLVLLGPGSLVGVHGHVAAELVVGSRGLGRWYALGAVLDVLLPPQGRHEQPLALGLLEPAAEVARLDVGLRLGVGADAHGLQPLGVLGLHGPDRLELLLRKSRAAAHPLVDDVAHLLVPDLLAAADEQPRQTDHRRG
ncbi:hypothetical protein [Streptomyces sp. AK010]|uniref:hypothetical protein n=1 Tax=Streptomyces sp. AK010 TaxID=2723074 RepID=UPI00160F3F5D|nr:hypothetical protein [Streptomyces sp. AK010]MBB6421781.1 hypothetical protein [Streptomyces sp. AK010]